QRCWLCDPPMATLTYVKAFCRLPHDEGSSTPDWQETRYEVGQMHSVRAGNLASCFSSGIGPGHHRHARLSQRNTDNRWEPTSAAASQVRGRDYRRCQGLEALLASDNCTPQRCAERAPDHDGRSGLRGNEHIRRRHSNANDGSDREKRAALYAVSLDSALLSYARRVNHWTKPSFSGLRPSL